MSADNWTTCPKCIELEKQRQAKAIDKASRAYGLVSESEHNRLVKLSAPIKLPETFSEHYEIGVDNEKFFVSYNGSCDVCGFQYRHKHERRFDRGEPSQCQQ